MAKSANLSLIKSSKTSTAYFTEKLTVRLFLINTEDAAAAAAGFSSAIYSAFADNLLIFSSYKSRYCRILSTLTNYC